MEALGNLLQIACFVAVSFLLAQAFPASLFLVLPGVPLLGLITGWVMLEPSGTPARRHVIVIGVLCVLLVPAMMTVAWAWTGYLTWAQWSLIPAATLGFWVIGAVASTILFRKGYRLPF